jgi:hypothetical protein
MQPIKLDICIKQGATLYLPLRWFTSVAVHKAITSAAPGWPTEITAAAHGMPAGRMPVWLTNLRGSMSQLNARKLNAAGMLFGERLDADTVLVDANSYDYDASTAGQLTYFPPMDLTGYTARWIFKASVAAATELFDAMTTTNGDIVLGDELGTIVGTKDAVATAAMDFTSGVHQLELESSDGFVARLAYGTVTLSRELG